MDAGELKDAFCELHIPTHVLLLPKGAEDRDDVRDGFVTARNAVANMAKEKIVDNR